MTVSGYSSLAYKEKFLNQYCQTAMDYFLGLGRKDFLNLLLTLICPYRLPVFKHSPVKERAKYLGRKNGKRLCLSDFVAGA